jgi:hypothetical protein
MTLSLLLAATLAQQAPLGIGKSDNMGNFSTDQFPQHIVFKTDGGTGNGAIDCLNISKGGGWECLALRSELPVAAPAPTPPTVLLPPSSSTPAGTWPVGTTYFNTTCARLLSFASGGWQTCPAASAGTPTQQAATPPALPSGAASTNRGSLYFDTAQGCMRSTRDGLTWGPCLNTEICTSVPVPAVSLPVLGATTTFTATLAGAITGKPCSVGAPAGILNIGVTFACAVTAPNVASFRFQGAVGLSVVGGNYTVCTEVLW